MHIPSRILISSLLLLGSQSVLAQIITDGSVGAEVKLAGPEMTIGAELGSQQGANLFHSFKQFDIPAEQRATFTGPDHIQNVIGRVTGGDSSRIDGTLRSQVGQADVYLINPAGVVMGPNATVDVPASLHVSTADELRFNDGAVYSASDPGRSTLTMAAPEAFGFLSPQPGAIELNGTRLEVKPGQALSLTAENIGITGSAAQSAGIQAPGGEIQLQAQGHLRLEHARLDTSGEGGGRIAITARNAGINQSVLTADNTGARHAEGGIELAVVQTLELTGGTHLESLTYGEGNGGSINITANEMTLDDYARIESHTHESSQGLGGAIEITVDGILQILDNARIQSETNGNSDAGAIAINSGIMTLNDGNVISENRPSSEGSAAAVTIIVDGLLQVLNGGQIESSARGHGDAGNVTITAGKMIVDRQDNSDFITGVTSNVYSDFEAHAGTIIINVDSYLKVFNGGVISSRTNGEGNSADIAVNSGSVEVNGKGYENYNGIYSIAYGNGRSGNVALDIDGSLIMSNGGVILSDTNGKGNAGDVTINANIVQLDDQSSESVTSISSDTFGSGDAGSVFLYVANLVEVLNGATISSDTYSDGNAGKITIEAGDVRINGYGEDIFFTGISSDVDPEATGNAGTIELHITGLLEVLSGGVISTGTWSQGSAGDVIISAGSARFNGQGSDLMTGVTSEAGFLITEDDTEMTITTGDAGSITLRITDSLEILNGAGVTSSTMSIQGNAGNIDIHARQLLIDGQRLTNLTNSEIFYSGVYGVATATATGQVGNIDIQADQIDLRHGGAISIEAQQTLPDSTTARPDNRIAIHANRLDIDGGLITTESTGNVPAAAIRIDGGVLWLQNSQITTSAEGARGDGGAIDLSPKQLVLDNGFIQANAASGNGGDIRINPQVLLYPATQRLTIGGSERLRFDLDQDNNIIQAVAPQGVSGQIQLAAVDLDISAALTPLRAPFEDPDALFIDACANLGGAKASTLVERGCGGLLPGADAPLTSPIGAGRLERLLQSD